MKERSRKTAERFFIVDRVERLEHELLAIDGVSDVDFDLDGFYDNLNQVIFLTKYNVYGTDWDYHKRRIISDVLTVADKNGLKRSGDAIEDYGEHFYFVFHCNWKI